MGVRIKTSKTFKTPINFFVLTEQGKQENWSFTAEFKRLSVDEVKELVAEKLEDEAFLKRVLVGWTMVDIESNSPIEFNDENFAEFCQIPKVAFNTALQYLDKVGASREKN